jgi:hypothetical protein
MRIALALPLALAACAAFPEVDRAGGAFADAPAPRLLPTDALLSLETAPAAGPDREAELLARASRLRARAEAIRGRPLS